MKAKDYLEQFKNEKQNDKSNNTVNAYISDLNQFFRFFKKDFEEIRTDDIEKFKLYLLNHKKMKPKSVNRKLVSIRRFIDFLNNKTKIKILAEVKQIKIQRQEYLEEVLSKNEFDRLIKAAEDNKDKRAIALFYGLYLTGARVSEFLQVRIGDIKVSTKPVEGKGSKYRDLFFPDVVWDYISDYVEGREAKDTDPIFINARNNNPMDRQAVHKLIKRYAGISKVKLSRAHAHSFRHLYAFMRLASGMTLDELADLLGHTDINTTRIYTRKTKEQLMKAVKRLH